jgi:hypothetical protein
MKPKSNGAVTVTFIQEGKNVTSYKVPRLRLLVLLERFED